MGISDVKKMDFEPKNDTMTCVPKRAF
jgi:hypothetical protein